MSIFGAMKRASKIEQASDLQINLDRMRLIVLNQINTIKSLHGGLQDSVPEVAIILTMMTKKNDNFDIPFEVTEGFVINFVSKSNSLDMLCTTVSLIMEIIK